MEISSSSSSHGGHQPFMATHQGLEQVLSCPRVDPQQTQNQQQQQAVAAQDRKARPQPEQALKCPRCESINTKFCYYNNYSLSQPRYFCKGCRRYWTHGGSLRNVPVGGGCRKNRKAVSSSLTSSPSITTHPVAKKPPQTSQQGTVTLPPPPPPQQTVLHHLPTIPSHLLPPPVTLGYEPSDLSLAFAKETDHNLFLASPKANGCGATAAGNPTVGGFLDILRGGGGYDIDANGHQHATGGLIHHPFFGFGDATGGISLDGGKEELAADAAFSTFECSMMACPNGGRSEHDSSACKGVENGVGEETRGTPGTTVVHHGQTYWPISGGDLSPYWSGLGSAAWHGLINSSLM